MLFFPPEYSSVFPWLQPLSKDGQRESIESEARLLHASLSHVKLSLVARRHQQWPKTAAPQKHSHAFHARLLQKCCSEIDTLFDVLLPAVNWEEHLWPFWSPAQSPKCSSLLNRSVADAKQSYEVSHSFFIFFSPALLFFGFLAVGLRPGSTEIRDDSCYRYAGLITCQLIADILAGQRGSLTFFPF